MALPTPCLGFWVKITFSAKVNLEAEVWLCAQEVTVGDEN